MKDSVDVTDILNLIEDLADRAEMIPEEIRNLAQAARPYASAFDAYIAFIRDQERRKRERKLLIIKSMTMGLTHLEKRRLWSY